MIRILLALSLLLTTAWAHASGALPFAQPRPGLHTGGQPSREQLASAAARIADSDLLSSSSSAVL